jgi:cytochrome oxidase Cu insertion factor (SCO1/SenC/PrrC family)
VGIFYLRAQYLAPARGPITVTGTPIGGDFTLIDQFGQTRTNRDFLGRYRLVFFGFTFCPSVCPTELQKITDVMAQLGTAADQVTPMFISIDPERDTSDVMAEFLGHFDARFVGLTGTRAQIDTVVRLYKVYAAKVPFAGSNDYTMDHSSFVYLMDRDGQLVTLYRAEQIAEQIAADLKSRF